MQEGRDRIRVYLIIGALIGGLISIVITFLMDFLFADALQGTWRGAISHDLNRCLSINTTPDSFLVYIVFGIILIILFLIGALMGSLFSLIIYRFFQFLGSPEK
jgi:hypothetical protein